MSGMNGELPAIGISMFSTDRSIHPTELATEIEARGFASLYLPEHSHIPSSRATPWPGARPGSDDPLPEYYSHMNDPLVALSMAAAVTQHLELGTSVTLVAQHDPIWLAKQFATLDHLSGGRVVMGAGFGWNVEQAENHGIDFRRRRQQTEEYIQTMRALWTDHEATYQGQFVNLQPSWAYPKPCRSGGLPIVMGGGHGPVLFDAIARYADGWMPITGRTSIADRLAPLQACFEAADRDPAAIEVIIAGCTTDPDGLINLGREGVGRTLLTIWQEDRDEILRTLDDYASIKDAVYGNR